MLAVAVCHCLLQARVKPHYVPGYSTELIFRKRCRAIYPLPFFGFLRKFFKARYYKSEPPGGDIAKRAHDQRHSSHYIEKTHVCPEQLGQRHGIRHRRAHHKPAAACCSRIEIGTAGAFAETPDCVSAAVFQSGCHLAAQTMVGLSHRVGAVVIHHPSVTAYNTYSQAIEHMWL